MSYILDALRKADAQRVADPARGIHAQAAAAAPARAGRQRPALQWAWALLALLIALGAGWTWFGAADKPQNPGPAAAAPADIARIAPPASAVLPAAPPVVIAAVPEVRPPPPAPAPVLNAAKQLPPAANAPPAAAPATTPAAQAERIYGMAELPADVQQAMPKLAVSGGVYSQDVAQRMLVVNGQVFNEGSEVAPGVVLQEVRPRAALLKFRGLRITHPY